VRIRCGAGRTSRRASLRRPDWSRARSRRFAGRCGSPRRLDWRRARSRHFAGGRRSVGRGSAIGCCADLSPPGAAMSVCDRRVLSARKRGVHRPDGVMSRSRRATHRCDADGRDAVGWRCKMPDGRQGLRVRDRFLLRWRGLVVHLSHGTVSDRLRNPPETSRPQGNET
jgi:hypothetical protein